MTQITSDRAGHAAPERRTWAIHALCWLIVVLDGYDLIVYGTTIPALLNEPGWDLSAGEAGAIGSLAFGGMLVGALGAGNLSDRLGRRRTIIGCVAWFSAVTALCALAPDAATFGALRFVAGVGLGGLVPSANALAAEFVTPRFRSVVATAMMSGIPIGGCAAALLAIPALPALGWRAMYAFAGVGMLVALLLAVLLPESPTWLRSRRRPDDAARIERQYGLAAGPEWEAHAVKPRFATLLQPAYRTISMLFISAAATTLFAWYGLATWLPKIAGDAQLDLGSNPLTYLLALNLGAVAGSSLTALAAMRLGPVRAAIIAAGAAAAGLGALTLGLTGTAVVYIVLVVAGVGTHGTQCLLISAIARHYPAAIRGTALGLALGAGRIGAVLAPSVAGWVLTSGLGVHAALGMFAGSCLLTAIAFALVHALTRARATGADAQASPALSETVPSKG